MTILDFAIVTEGHEITFAKLDEIVVAYYKACYGTGEFVAQPDLKEKSIEAIRALSPFYSEHDVVRILTRAARKRLLDRSKIVAKKQ